MLFIFLFVPFLSFCKEKKKGYNGVMASYATHTLYDKGGVKYDNIRSNEILPRNTGGYNFALQYERTTKLGIVLSFGLQKGERNFDIIIRRDFSDFDPQAVSALKGVIFQDRKYASLSYFGPVYAIGYRLPFKKKWVACVKLSRSSKNFINGMQTQTFDAIDYVTDNGSARSPQAAYTETRLGRTIKFNLKDALFTTPFSAVSYDMYLGIERNMNLKYLKYISLGVEGGTSTINMNKIKPTDCYVLVYSLEKWDGRGSADGFMDRNRWLGIRIGASLWK